MRLQSFVKRRGCLRLPPSFYRCKVSPREVFVRQTSCSRFLETTLHNKYLSLCGQLLLLPSCCWSFTLFTVTSADPPVSSQLFPPCPGQQRHSRAVKVFCFCLYTGRVASLYLHTQKHTHLKFDEGKVDGDLISDQFCSAVRSE